MLVSQATSPQRKLINANYCKAVDENNIEVVEVKFDFKNMCLDLDDLRSKISEKTSLVYFENPNYLGFIETQAPEIVKIAHEKGALVCVGVDPISLGVLEAPGAYDADYAVGELQPLGIPMQAGGGLGGFICTRDEEKFIAEYPSLLFGVLPSVKEGQYGFGQVAFERTSYASRKKERLHRNMRRTARYDSCSLYGLMGPGGFKERERRSCSALHMEKSSSPRSKASRYLRDITSRSLSNFDETGKTGTNQ